MDRFPAEIWQQILDDCEIKTAKQLRCCSKDFNDFASPTVFEEVYFSFCSIDSINRLRKVAHHSTLRHYVRRLFFLNMILDDKYRNYWEWEQALDLRESYKLSERRNGGCRMAYIKVPKFIDQEDEEDVSMTLVPRQVLYKGRDPVYTMIASRKLLKRYHQCTFGLIEAQTHVLSSNVPAEIYDLAITSFSNLKDIRICRSESWPSLVLNSYDFISGNESIPIPIVTALQRDVLLNNPFARANRHLLFGPQNSETHINSAALSLTRALTKAQKKIQVMDFNKISWSMEAATSPTDRDDYKCYTRAVLPNLRTLIFKLEWQGLNGSEPGLTAMSTQFADFLSSAVNLEEAFLDFEVPSWTMYDDLNPQQPPYYIWKWNDPHVSNLSSIFGQVQLPKLKHLRLQECAITGSAFTQFMTRHSQTLRSLEIGQLKLVSGSQGWRPVMEAVAPKMSLDMVKIDRLIDGVVETQAQRSLGEPRGGNRLAFEDRHLTVTALWQEHGRLVADFLQRSGVGDYPCWPLFLPDDGDNSKRSRGRLYDDIY